MGTSALIEVFAEAPPLPDKPSVAILAFQNMSGDIPSRKYLKPAPFMSAAAVLAALYRPITSDIEPVKTVDSAVACE
jgi:hypothetical protein